MTRSLDYQPASAQPRLPHEPAESSAVCFCSVPTGLHGRLTMLGSESHRATGAHRGYEPYCPRSCPAPALRSVRPHRRPVAGPRAGPRARPRSGVDRGSDEDRDHVGLAQGTARRETPAAVFVITQDDIRRSGMTHDARAAPAGARRPGRADQLEQVGGVDPRLQRPVLEQAARPRRRPASTTGSSRACSGTPRT